jgi:hypothetical protein
MSFVDLRRNGGSSENRTRDLALWVPDLFMRRVERRRLEPLVRTRLLA